MNRGGGWGAVGGKCLSDPVDCATAQGFALLALFN